MIEQDLGIASGVPSRIRGLFEYGTLQSLVKVLDRENIRDYKISGNEAASPQTSREYNNAEVHSHKCLEMDPTTNNYNKNWRHLIRLLL
jgi:hypothetical protein